MRTSRRAGFTLIELIVAAVILTVGILSLSALAHRLSGDLRSAHLTEQADLRARSILDSLVGLGYSALAPDDTTLDESGAQVTEDSVGLKEIVVVVRDDAAAISVADTLATRLSGR